MMKLDDGRELVRPDLLRHEVKEQAPSGLDAMDNSRLNGADHDHGPSRLMPSPVGRSARLHRGRYYAGRCVTPDIKKKGKGFQCVKRRNRTLEVAEINNWPSEVQTDDADAIHH
ncbi:hypothetical protein CHU98_g11011 [Xylaria longipes]|nr:hypothetical protein CHU98_g11011 [Xylaria longipes]